MGQRWGSNYFPTSFYFCPKIFGGFEGSEFDADDKVNLTPTGDINLIPTD